MPKFLVDVLAVAMLTANGPPTKSVMREVQLLKLLQEIFDEVWQEFEPKTESTPLGVLANLTLRWP
jgi:hypothetical protein